MQKVSGLEREFPAAPMMGTSRSKVALALLAAPLMLSGCMSDEKPMNTASVAPKAGDNATDAYGYAPVRLMAFADGTRAAMPSAKPDVAKLEADRAVKAPAQRARVDAKTEEAAKSDPEFALKADVAERKASLIQVSEAVPQAMPAALPQVDRSAPGKGARVSALTPAPASKDALGSTIAAVSETAGVVTQKVGETAQAVGETAQAVGAKAQAVGVSVGTGAKAIAVAAIDRTSAAASAIGDRLGDTFKGRDTITGDAHIDRLIEKAAAENGIPSELAYAVVRVESHYNPLAKGSGVYGLSQIQPATARGLGFSGPNSDLFDAETNLRYGMKYLAGAWQQGGHDVCQTAMKYKGGHRTTRMSASAAAYCANVKRHMAAIERRRAPASSGVIIASSRMRGGLATTFAGETLAQAAPLAGAVPQSQGLPVAAAATSLAGREIAASALAPADVARPAPRLVPADRWQATADAASVPMNVSFSLPGDGTRGGRVR